MHHISLAEKGIQTFKGHFNSVLCWVDNLFSLNLGTGSSHKHKCKWTYYGRQTWHQKYQHVRTSTDHMISMHANGTIGVRRTNIKKPDCRASWATHSISGWYLGTSTKNYCCYHVWSRETGAKKSIRHSLLQAHIHNNSNSDTWICSRTDSLTTHSRTQSKFGNIYGRKCNKPTQQIGCNLQHDRQEVLATRIKPKPRGKAENPYTRSKVTEGTGTISKGEHSNSTHTHVEQKHNNKREKLQTTTNPKLNFPRWIHANRKANTLYNPGWRQSISKEHTVHKW